MTLTTPKKALPPYTIEPGGEHDLDTLDQVEVKREFLADKSLVIDRGVGADAVDHQQQATVVIAGVAKPRTAA